MKTILLLLLFIFSFPTFAQNSYIVNKKGEKLVVQDGAWDILVIDKRISYKLPGKTWEKYITFSDLDYAILGNFKFKSFVINKKKRAFFVHLEDEGKSLISLSVTTTVTNGGLSSSNTAYEIFVVDSQSKVLAQLDFHSYKNHIAAKARGELPDLIKTNFPNCANVIAAIDKANTHDDLNLGILDFLHAPILLSCN